MENSKIESKIFEDFIKTINNENYEKFDNVLSNKTLLWSGTDSEERWQKNLHYNKDKFTLDYYTKNPITYVNNNYGYRTPYDFKEGDEVNIFLGCSHTYGIGVHLESSWPYIVNNEVGGNLANLALGGMGIENQLRHLLKWIKFFKIKNVFHLQPIYAREEFLYDSDIIDYLVSHPDSRVDRHFKTDFLRYTLSTNPYLLRKYLTVISTIELLSIRNNFNYFYSSKLDMKREIKTSKIDSRDFSHPQPHIHAQLAERFLTMYEHNRFSNIFSSKII